MAIRSFSTWKKVPLGPSDAIFGITDAFNKDPNPKKVLLGAGTYKTDQNSPYTLNCVKKAEEQIKNLNKEYAPISGDLSFTKVSAELAFGSKLYEKNKGTIATVQTISGTGALYICGVFLERFYSFPDSKTIYLPNPSWANHRAIFGDAGLKCEEYSYYNSETCSLDFNSLLRSFENLQERSVVLLHASAHNPTGVDLSQTQWKQVLKILKVKKIFPVFDMAYQGFATGDIERDAFSPRLFLVEDYPIALCQSYSKNMGLYGERVGALSFKANSVSEAEAIVSQLKIIIRPRYSNPPIHGSQIVTKILTDMHLRKEWEEEIKIMANRIILMRKLLKDGIEKAGSNRDWSHITNQIGMFSYTGLNKSQVEKLKNEYSIYMTTDGRISISGLTSQNVEYVSQSIHQVTNE